MGEKHPDTIVTMHNIAELHLSNGIMLLYIFFKNWLSPYVT